MFTNINKDRLKCTLQTIYRTCDIQDCCSECPLHGKINCELFFDHPINWDNQTIDKMIKFISYVINY